MAAKKSVSAQSVSNANTAGSTPASKAPVAAPAVAAPAAAAVVAAPVVAKPAAPTIAAPAPVKTEAGRDRSTIVALIAKLHEADADTARDAAVTLGTLPADAEAITALCAVVRNADDYFHPVVRAAAATALGKLKDPRAVDALIHATGDSMAEASEEAVKALGLLGDRRAISALERIVKNEQHFYLDPVRRTAEEALLRIRG